jgi:arginine utilization regulatory protein
MEFPIELLDYLKHPLLIIDKGGDILYASPPLKEQLKKIEDLETLLAAHVHWTADRGEFRLIEFDDLSLPQRLIAENAEHIFDLVDDGLQIVDRNGVAIFYNSSSAEFEGFSKSEVLGHSVLELYPHLQKNQCILFQVLDTGTPVIRKEYVYASIKKDKIESITSTIPLSFEGNLVGAAEIVHNIKNIRVLSEHILNLHDRLEMKTKGKKFSGARYTFDDIIGRDKEFRKAVEFAQVVAQKDLPVLIYGETGTGKEFFAQSIHNASSFAKGHFVAVNCAAIPGNLLESMLFGTVKGAFTGSENRAGLLEYAAGGTIFFDEVQSLSPELQAKLLRLLQENTFQRVGDVEEIPLQARVISAMNVLPEDAIESGKLRPDLYYRFCVFKIAIPPLRERKDDISLYVDHFVEEYNRESGSELKGVNQKTRRFFNSYSWPGNVRELEHMILSHAVMTSPGGMIAIDPKIFSPLRKFSSPKSQLNKEIPHLLDKPLPDVLRETERNLIEQSLLENHYNVTKAARALGISRQSLQYRIARLRSD